MGKYKLSKNRLFIYICTLYIMGLLSGLLIIKSQQSNVVFVDSNFLKIFFSNYWYIFLMWIFGFSAIGLLFNTLIIYFRGFLFGALTIILIPYDLNRLFLLFLIEIILFIPVLFTLGYISMQCSLACVYGLFHSYRSRFIEINKYINLMFVITLLIIVYSLLVNIV